MIHEFGAKEEFTVEFNEAHDCVLIEYFTLTQVVVSVDGHEQDLQVIIKYKKK